MFLNLNIKFNKIKNNNNKYFFEKKLNNLLKINLNNDFNKKYELNIIGCGSVYFVVYNKFENVINVHVLQNKQYFREIKIYNNNYKNILVNSKYIVKKYKFDKLKIKQIEIGGGHFLVLLENNDLMSFGNNRYAQCGFDNKKYEIINTPRKIEFPPCLIDKNKKIKDIKCGNISSMVLLDNNDLFVFGRKFDDDDIIEDFLFTKIKGDDFYNEKIIKIYSSYLSDDFICVTNLGIFYYTKNIRTTFVKYSDISIKELETFDVKKIDQICNYCNIYHYMITFILINNEIYSIIFEDFLKYTETKYFLKEKLQPYKQKIKKFIVYDDSNLILLTKDGKLYCMGPDYYDFFGIDGDTNIIIEIPFFKNKKIIDIFFGPDFFIAISDNNINYGCYLNSTNNNNNDYVYRIFNISEKKKGIAKNKRKKKKNFFFNIINIITKKFTKKKK